MTPKRNRKDRDVFMEALQLWDRPERELFGTPLASDTDTDSFIDRAFAFPSGGVVID